MNKQHYGLSVISYTYDDHALITGLLASLADWDCVPREILIVDDGSKIPFALPEGLPAAARVLRLEPNRGPGQAKIAGLSAATSRFLVSLDADIRLPPDWITRALPLAARPEIGLVTAPILTDVGDDLLAAYQRLRFSHLMGFTGEPKVAPAGLWLLRREVWQAHGFAEYRQRLHEDVYFSDKLHRAGLTLHVVPEPPARQIRRFSRRTMTRRGWTWQGREYLAAARTDLTGAINAFLLSMQTRMRRHHAVDVRFLYYDYLYCAYALIVLLRQSEAFASLDAPLAAALAADLPEPALGELFLADLTALGCPTQGAVSHPLIAAIRQGVRSILPPDGNAAWRAALPALLAEDARGDWDSSFYDEG